jgi:hypothetical protein
VSLNFKLVWLIPADKSQWRMQAGVQSRSLNWPVARRAQSRGWTWVQDLWRYSRMPRCSSAELRTSLLYRCSHSPRRFCFCFHRVLDLGSSFATCPRNHADSTLSNSEILNSDFHYLGKFFIVIIWSNKINYIDSLKNDNTNLVFDSLRRKPLFMWNCSCDKLRHFTEYI